MSNTQKTPNETRAFTTPSGGVMTNEAGAITGDVEVWINPAHPEQLAIRYAEADDTYNVTGQVAGRSLDELVEILTTDPGLGGDGNPASSHL